MTARTDPHRPGAIIPSDYSFVLDYSFATTVEGWPQPAYGLDCRHVVLHSHEPNQQRCPMGGCPRMEHHPPNCCIASLREIVGVAFFHKGGPGKCSVCGASFVYGEVWRHKLTGEHVHVGHDCADKYNLFHDRSAWERWHKEQKEMRARAAKEKRFKTAALRYLDERPELRAALELGAETSDPNTTPGMSRKEAFARGVLYDMGEKLQRYGSLSDRQVAFALKLADELLHPATVVEERHVPAPEGRVDFTGTVVSVKVHGGDWGSTWKMTVKVETPEGSWLAWLTVPQALCDAVASQDRSLPEQIRGRRVTLRAALQRGSEVHFAFGKRPTFLKIEEVA